MSNIYYPEYNLFVKTFLVNQCYIEYCKNVSSNQNGDDCKNALFTNMNNIYLWDSVFRLIRIPLNYYVGLLSHSTDDCSVTTPLHKQYIVYFPTNSFQEYIDERIHLQSAGASDYMAFTKSMQIPDFKQSMVDKYMQSEYEKVIKNHLIYLVRLYVMKNVSGVFFSENETLDMELSLHLVPYFDYLSATGITMDDIDTEYVDDSDTKKIDEIQWLTLERQMLKYIKYAM